MTNHPSPNDAPYKRQVQHASEIAHEAFLKREGFHVQPIRGRPEIPADYWQKFNASLKVGGAS